MDRPRFQLSLAAMLGVVACIALNIWLFRLGPLLGIFGLNISKHVIIAYLCQALGVDRTKGRSRRPAVPLVTPQGVVDPAFVSGAGLGPGSGMGPRVRDRDGE
jgi:hypothetical protein